MKKYIFLFVAISAGLIFYRLFFVKKDAASITTHIDVSNLQTEDRTLTHRTIRVENRVTKKMLGYRYLGTNHFPNKFAITLNNKVVPQGECLELPVTDNKLEVTYDYSFAKGLYKGKQAQQFTLNPEKDTFAITFSWKSTPRIKIQEAELDSLV